MEPGSKRWVEVTPSEHAHERGGLAAIRAQLADADPYRAWSNFTFTTRSGRQYEVDLLVLGKGGIYLLELKHWSGTITGDHQTWFHNRGAEDNPRILADNKAKHFKQLLLDAGGRDLPFVHAGVVLHQPDAQVRLTERGRHGVYRIDGQGPSGLDELVKDALAAEPRMPRDLINGRRSAELARLIEKAGVRRSVRHRKVGNMLLEDDPLAEGPGWQDYLAKHPVLERVRRVRFYLVNQAASQEDRTSILRAAKREFVTLENLNHPGIARAIEFYEHERGPAVVFEHDPTETRLDHFLQQKASDLTVDQRIDLVRTLANTLRYAHSRRLVHRRLSPLSIFVRTLAHGRYGVRIRDWHTAGQLVPGSPSHSTYVAGTRTLEALTDKGAHGYIAPETLHNPSADAILADVFGLGAVSYLVFTGSAPAENSEMLQQRLARERGLDVAAELDGAAQAMIDLVRDATAGDVDLRTESVERFVQGLEQLVGELTAAEEVAQQIDPLDAVPGSKIGPADDPVRFEVVERLGQGSTALALLVKDTKKAEDAKYGQAVLKVALDEDGARKRLLDEAEVLPLVRDLRIAGNLEDPMLVGGRTALLLENAGRESLAAMIRREGRLSLDFLGRWGKDLLEILSALDLAGVNHRDIKPDNLAFRELGKSREVHLTLFDFSLSRAPLEQTGVGTPPYLDPFFDPVHRPRYDAAAERYAAAVTLHEMATGQTPVYGTGNSHPALIDSDVTIDPDAFEPGPARDGVIAFLRKALARNVADRHDSIESMRIEWRAVFDAVPPAAATPTSVNPVTGQELDEAAGRAALDTPIASAGLTPRAVDALHRIDVRTVRDLLARSPFELSRLSGVADPTKREIRRRAKQWRARLQSSIPVAVADDDNPAGSGRGVDAVLRSLIPKAAKQNSTEARVLRLYLGLEEMESAWPSNAELGSAADVTAGRVGQILPAARKGWRQRRSLTEVRDEIVDLVADAGGVLSAEGIAEALLTSRGSEAAGDQRTRRALGLVRAAVEVEGERGGEARLLHRRCHDSAVVALEKPTDPDAVPGTDLLDYAVRLGKIADLLAAEDPLPTAAQTEARLRGVRLPQGMAELSAERLAALAAAASEKAAANGRGEIYPDGMDPRRALEQLASSLGVVRHGMDPDQLKARVRARYPKVGDLPESRHDLDALLQLAKVPLVFSGGAYRPRDIQTSNLPTSHWPGRTRLGGASADRDLADFERRMEVSLQERGSVTLSVDYPFYARAIPALRDRFGLQVLDVTAELLTAMRASADAYNVDWSIVLRADRPDAAPQDVANLRRLVELAAAGLEERLLTDPAPLLVVEAAPLARYDRLAVLEWLADKATARPAARWLLVPVDRDGQPYIDHRPAPGALGALRLSTTWVNEHRQQAAS